MVSINELVVCKCLFGIIDPPGSRLGVQLMSLSQQHIIDRVNLISAQHNLGAPLRSVSNLLAIACEVRSVATPRHPKYSY